MAGLAALWLLVNSGKRLSAEQWHWSLLLLLLAGLPLLVLPLLVLPLLALGRHEAHELPLRQEAHELPLLVGVGCLWALTTRIEELRQRAT